VQGVIDHIPASHLLEPVDNEVYDSAEVAIEQLVDYSFFKGFLTVRDSGSTVLTAKAPLVRMAYKYHGEETRNYRSLSNFKEKESHQQEATKVS
jgi:hypothetical protein